MRSPGPAIWLALVAGMIWLSLADQTNAFGQQHNKSVAKTPPNASAAVPPRPPIAITDIPSGVRDGVRKVLEEPTLTARGPSEVFRGRPSLYYWLLDHPDRAAAEWRRMGYPCVEITERGQGRHGWTDHAGSSLQWETVYRAPGLRVWYAEGAVRPGLLMPAVPVRAAVVLHHGERADSSGRLWLQQQADLFVYTDSKTAAAIAKLLGPAAPKAAEQCVVQLQTFFSALVRLSERRARQAERPPTGDTISPKK